MKQKQRVAIFDIDGTIFRSSLLIEVVNALIERKIFPKNAQKLFERKHMRWMNREDSYMPYIAGVVRAFEKHITGVRRDDFIAITKKVAVLHNRRVYRYTRELLKTLHEKGYFLLAISHSPKYMVDAFAESYGFRKAYGTMLQVDENQRFTGKTLDREIIFDKAKVLRRALKKENLSLQGSIGVGDTESDIPFLELVHDAICFNPSSKLYSVARRRGWKIVVERKDVIYHI